MKHNHHIHIALMMAAVLACITIGCSTQRNTAKSRWWHSFNARYNTYYNGSLAYIDGSLEKETANKDNFTEIIPLYTVGNKANRETGKANFDRAIEKCQKAIKLHSIKRRPEWTKKRRKTERDIEWLQRKEYNPFLWKAWLLMGRSQFHKGAFDEAASTFAYMSRIYATQPAIYGRARAWLAKSYIEEGWMYDAEDVIRNMQRDSIHWRAQKEWDYTLADYYIHTADYPKAVEYLRKVIKHEMRSKQRAREWYLMGQLQAAMGHNDLATKAYKRVIRQNPPYEVEFNARIALTEVLSTGGQAKKMISRLKRMAASDKNKEYLDQVYYAIGNIYLSQKDTANAITAYERGNTKSTRSGIEKGVLLLKLGDIYWNKERYNDAQRCYGEAIGLLDKERPDYDELSTRSKVLDELVPYTDAVHLQDSLQALAKADEKTRNAAIDRVIEALKKKEKEERDRMAEQNAQDVIAKNSGGNVNTTGRGNNTASSAATQQKGAWYFYNQMAVNQGKNDFQKRWGKRENTDNWQRINKTVVAMGGGGVQPDGAQTDSIPPQDAAADSLAATPDSAQNDPHKREYYLAQIPFTPEQVAESNQTIMDGLYNSGVIFKDKLDNLALSEKALRRITDQYPDFERMPDVLYHLFLLYSRRGETTVADRYVSMLKQKYPDNQWTTLLTDPYFKENARFGEHIEDSLYAATYDAFKDARYTVVRANAKLSATRFPVGANRDKFMFVSALGQLNDGNADACVSELKDMLQKFPQSGLAEMAGMIVRGVDEGRKLRGGSFDIGNVWERRSTVLNDNDSTAAKALSDERNTDFVFMLAYAPDSTDENKLLFELARYNFTSYMVRNFDIAIDDDGGLHRMQVSGFRSFDEALQYARHLYRQSRIMQILGKGRGIIISTQNLPLLGRQFSYDDYDAFYSKHFAPLKISTDELLTEPDIITTEGSKDDTRRRDDTPTPPTDGTVIPDEPAAKPATDGTVIPDEPAAKPTESGTVIPDSTQTVPADDGTIVPDTPQTEPADDGTIIPDVELPHDDGGTVIPDDSAKPQEAKAQPKDTKAQPKDNKPQAKPTARQQTAKPKPTPTARPTSGSTAKPKPQQPATAKPTKGAKPQQAKPQPTPTPKKKENVEDEFYFDDDQPTQDKKKNDSKNKKKEDKSDLEDEYYDLDGF